MNDHQPPTTTLSGHQHQQRRHGRYEDNRDEDEMPIREIHALQPPPPPWRAWETSSHISSNSWSTASDNFTTMSREFNALVVAGSAIENNPPSVQGHHQDHNYIHQGRQNNIHMNLGMIGEGRDYEETNPLATVHRVDDASSHIPLLASPRRVLDLGSSRNGEISMQRVKEEEVESRIAAWENAKVAKINNRFKREDVIISTWENAQVERASASIKKVERKLEEKRARALEKMNNDIAKAHRKAEEKRASAGAKRGTKVAKVLEVCNLMRALGRDPSKRSFFPFR